MSPTILLRNTGTVQKWIYKASLFLKRERGMVSCEKRKVKMTVVYINTNWYFWFIKQLDLPHLHTHLKTELTSKKWSFKEIVSLTHSKPYDSSIWWNWMGLEQHEGMKIKLFFFFFWVNDPCWCSCKVYLSSDLPSPNY